MASTGRAFRGEESYVAERITRGMVQPLIVCCRRDDIELSTSRVWMTYNIYFLASPDWVDLAVPAPLPLDFRRDTKIYPKRPFQRMKSVSSWVAEYKV